MNSIILSNMADEKKTRFWQVKWLEQIPDMHTRVVNKRLLWQIARNGDSQNINFSWNSYESGSRKKQLDISPKKEEKNWKFSELGSELDSLFWKATKDGKFTVKSCND